MATLMATCRSAPAQTQLPLHLCSSNSHQNCNYSCIIKHNFLRNYCPPWRRASLEYYMKRGSNRLLLLRRQSERHYSVNRVRAAGDSDEVMKPPFNVLITGSSKGIGYALAKEFLRAGDNVIMCSRSDDLVQAAVENLRGEFGDQRVWGTTCDVRDGEKVRALVDFAKNTIRYVDIWINNAGSNAYSYKPLVETGDEALMEVVTTNTLGTMICCREAIMMMMIQPRGGHIFNIDGAGADGSPTPRFAAYGATKRSLVHLTKSLQAELRMQGIKTVAVHNLSPGMVTTDLLMSGSNTKQAKFFINVLAEPADTERGRIDFLGQFDFIETTSNRSKLIVFA